MKHLSRAGKWWLLPKPTQSEAPAESEPPVMVMAIVRPDNSYGGHAPGAIVEVTERELRAVPHALESVAAYESRKAAEAAEPAVAKQDWYAGMIGRTRETSAKVRRIAAERAAEERRTAEAAADRKSAEGSQS